MDAQFHREYLLRLPLPLAQLYSRAYNAKDARSRHDNCYYLFEVLIKLPACPLMACYVQEIRQGGVRVAKLDQLLLQLAFPALGQWMAILREMARHYGALPDAASHPLGEMWGQLNRPHQDPSALTALYRRIKNGPDGQPSGDQSCTVLQLFETLVQYRNGVIGHGAGRFESFYADEMGPLLFPAVNEILAEGTFSPLGPPGARLAYLTELRAVSEERFELEMRELTGTQGERMAPLTLEAHEAAGLAPNRPAVLWPDRRMPLRLDPLLIFRESEIADEVLLLNGDRSGRQVEYLSYTTGRTERTKDTVAELAALLSTLAGKEITESQLQDLAAQSRAATPSVEALTEPAAPVRQLGDYEILAEIGRGGMGVVYLARQLSLGRLVALKMLPADLAGDQVALARFRREMRALGRCEHPNIVKLLDSGTFPDGQVYYTMEYVSGCDLDQVWNELARSGLAAKSSKLGNTTFARAVISASGRRRKEVESRCVTCVIPGGGMAKPDEGPPVAPRLPLPPLSPPLPKAEDNSGGYVRKVVTLIRDAALALQAVHDQGIVHRDISPANLMLTPDGTRVVLMDFGLAKSQNVSHSLTEKGDFVGKLRYAAPEQLAAAMLKVGPQADVRGMGVTLWEILTRRRLFEEAQDPRQLTIMVHNKNVPFLRQIDRSFDPDLEAIVARATERNAADRIESAGRLAEYLQLYLDGKPLPIRTPTLREISYRWAREHKAVVATAVTVLCLIGAMYLALRERAARQATVLMKEFEERLNSEVWNEAHYEELNALAAKLVVRNPASAHKMRAELNQRFDKHIREEMSHSSLGEKEIASIGGEISLLASRDPSFEAPLRALLQTRLMMWQTVASLEAPFGAREEVFGANRVQAVGDGLVRGSAAESPLILSRVACLGRVQAEAVFAPSWTSAGDIGIVLNGAGQQAYYFILAADPRSTGSKSFDGVRKAGGVYLARIVRNAAVLREQRIEARTVAPGPLRLQAGREGNRLSLQINDLPPVSFYDPFYFGSKEPGVYGLWWPGGAALKKLILSRQAMPVAPSPLEQGDALYADGHIPEALAFYRAQAILASPGAGWQEARYKEALCLLDLKQTEEAAEALQQVAVTSGGTWPVAAASQLWLLRLSQKRMEEANAIEATLIHEKQGTELMALIPEQLRTNILIMYSTDMAGFDILLEASRPRVKDLERAVAVMKLLNASPATVMETQRLLIRAYGCAGQEEAAARLAEDANDLADNIPVDCDEARAELMGMRILVLEEYGTIMRARKTPQEALTPVEAALLGPKGYRPESLRLLVERARILTACGRPAEAEKDVELLLARLRLTARAEYYFFSNACLLLGFLRERRGDEAGAMEAWRLGYESVDASSLGSENTRLGLSVSTVLNKVIMGALSDRLNDRDMGILLRILMGQDETVRAVAGAMLPRNILREPWRTPRGRELAFHIACRDLPFQEYYREILVLGGMTEMVYSAFQGKATPEEEEIIIQTARGFYDTCLRSPSRRTYLLQFALAWDGITNSFGWGGLKQSLDPALRAPFSYVIGCRYVQTGKAEEAAVLFGEALAGASDGSPLQRLVKGRLESLRPKPTPK